MDKECGEGPFSSLSRDMLNYRLRAYDVHDPSRYKEWENLGSRMALELFKNKKLLKSKDESVLEKELLLLFEGLKGVQNQDIQAISKAIGLSKQDILNLKKSL